MSSLSGAARAVDRMLFGRLQGQFYRELAAALDGCDSILDLGCGSSSPIALLPLPQRYSVGVDVFEPAVEHSRSRRIHDRYLVADVTDIDRWRALGSFDAVVAVDLLEHIDKPVGYKVLSAMEAAARRCVVILTTNGFVPQHAEGDNPYQTHRSGWTAREMHELGYQVTGINGWRPLRGGHAVAKWWPRTVWSRISFLTQPLTTSRPDLAFAILCVKQSVGVRDGPQH